MKSKGWMVILVISVVKSVIGEVLPIPSGLEKEWINYLIPLPKEIIISGKKEIDPASISLWLRQNPGAIEKQAFVEIEELFRSKTGQVPSGKGFEILIGVLNEDGTIRGIRVKKAGRLKDLPNKEQAYIIQSYEENVLIVTGLNEKGVYYGVQTLKQLLSAGISDKKLCIPVIDIVDWPDFEERGVWNISPDISWMASLKLNYRRIAAIQKTFRRDEKITSNLNRDTLKELYSHAFVLCVSTNHLNFLNRPDSGKLYDAYPELAGKGDSAFQKTNPSPYHQVPCASEPVFIKVLEGIMLDMAENGASEADVWQSEFISYCSCERCTASGKGQIGLETDAIIAALREVQKKYPDFKLRIFFSLADKTPQTAMALKTLPAEVKINYVYGPQEVFNEAALNGRWVAYWMVPVYMKFALNPILENLRFLYNNRWSAAYGYSGTPFSHAALAEWTWNLNGRSERDFAIAWAIRQGYEKPEVFAEWVGCIGPLNQDMYPSWVSSRVHLRALTKEIGPGGKNFGHIGDIGSKLSMARKAISLSEELKKEDLILESKQALSFFTLVDAAAKLVDIVSDKEKPLTEKQTLADEAMKNLEKAVVELKAVDSKTEFNEVWLEKVRETVKKYFMQN